MSDTKKYYWLKLMKDFFTQPKIKKLRKIAGGDTYTIIYLKLQLLSIDNSAVLEYQGIEPTFVEEMALTIDEDPENVSVTINYLITQGLMEKVDDAHYLLTETLKVIGSETTKAQLMRRKRQIEKQIAQDGNNVTTMLPPVTFCYTEKEKEKEIDKELDKEIETETEKKKEKRETFVSVLNSYTSNTELLSALTDFVEMRKKMKGFTTRALRLALNKLDTMASNDAGKTEIVNQSVMNGWKSFYPVKNGNNYRHENSVQMPAYWQDEQNHTNNEEDPAESIRSKYETEKTLFEMNMITAEEFEERTANYKAMYKDLTGKELS